MSGKVGNGRVLRATLAQPLPYQQLPRGLRALEDENTAHAWPEKASGLCPVIGCYLWKSAV